MADTPRRIIAPPPLDAPKYGLGRYHSPRRYGCAHTGCTGAASTLARSGAHEVAPGNFKTHNCCGDHDPQPTNTTDQD